MPLVHWRHQVQLKNWTRYGNSDVNPLGTRQNLHRSGLNSPSSSFHAFSTKDAEGGAVECCCMFASFPNATYKCKIFNILFRKILESTLTQVVSSWLNSDLNDGQHDLTLLWLVTLIFMADSTLTWHIWWFEWETESWVEFESRLMSWAQPYRWWVFIFCGFPMVLRFDAECSKSFLLSGKFFFSFLKL